MAPRVVSFHYTLKNQQGETLDSSSGAEPLTYLEGAEQIIPGLETQMKALKVGDKQNIKVVASDAYGEYDKELVIEVPRTKLPKVQDLTVGDRFSTGTPQQPGPIFTVSKIGLEQVTLDGNHPLAGQDLFFDVEVMQVREATKEELEHGHAHGGDGHHH